MSNDRTFVWYDLQTTDKAAAEAFYGGLFGWNFVKGDKGDGYIHLKNGENGFGGVGDVQGGAPPHWLGYVGSDDVSGAVARLSGLGAKTVMPAMSIPDVGTIAVLSDPTGALFALYQSAHDAPSDWKPARESIGDIGWADVTVDDVERGKTFYSKAFGWSAGEGVGAPGEEYYMLSGGESPFGGLMKRPEMMPMCAWTYYVNVEDADAISAKAKELGGRVLHEETVPDMVKFAVLQDPQGAVLGVVQSLRAS